MVPKILYEYINHPQKPFYYTYSTNMTTYNQYIYIYVYIWIFVLFNYVSNIQNITIKATLSVQSSNRSLFLGHIPWFGKVSQQPSHCKLCGTTSACALPDVPPSWKKKTVDRFLLQMMMCLTPTFFFPKKQCFNMISRSCWFAFPKDVECCHDFSYLFVQFQFDSSYFCCPAPPGSFVARSHA